MSESNFNLRGIPSEVMILLKKEARRLHISVNTLVLKMIKKGLGLIKEKPIHHELDYLAGTWSAKEVEEFKENIFSFEQIDNIQGS